MADVNLREWAVIRTANGSYIARFCMLPVDGERSDYENMKDEVLEVFRDNSDGVITVHDALDFLCQLRTAQQRNQLGETRPVFEKQPIVTALDMVLGDGVEIYIKPTSIYFCGDLTGNDADLYKNLIASALDMRHRSRLAAAGIELAGRLPAIHGT